MHTLDSNQISWCGKQGSCFVSDLPFNDFPNQFKVKSRKTQKVITFSQFKHTFDIDDDRVKVDYRSLKHGIYITVFND